MRAWFIFLGSGASLGVPVIGCKCKTCQSSDPKDWRLRSAGLIQYKDKNILIDAGPDIRYQLLREQIDHLEGLLITHSHFDHIGGLDELRLFSFQRGAPLPCLLSEKTQQEMQRRFDYLFLNSRGNTEPAFVLQRIDQQVKFLGLKMSPIHYLQAGMEVTGFRIGNLAYLCDIKEFKKTIFAQLKGVNSLVISASKIKSSKNHFTLDQAIAFAKKVGAPRTYLTHLSHELNYAEVAKLLPSSIELAFDGLRLPFDIS